jgi:hypothetical protein
MIIAVITSGQADKPPQHRWPAASAPFREVIETGLSVIAMPWPSHWTWSSIADLRAAANRSKRLTRKLRGQQSPEGREMIAFAVIHNRRLLNTRK